MSMSSRVSCRISLALYPTYVTGVGRIDERDPTAPRTALRRISLALYPTYAVSERSAGVK